MKIHEKPERKKITQKEKFNYVNGNYKRILWIQVNLIQPFLIGRGPYLYKSCQIDKAREFYLV